MICPPNTVYPKVSDEVSITDGTPSGTLFVSVDKTFGKLLTDPQTKQRVSLEDCARGYWRTVNLSAAHAYECEYLMARLHGKIVGVWKINRKNGNQGWMDSALTPKLTWPSDIPKDYPREGCELIAVDDDIKDRLIGKSVNLGRCHNTLRGYFASI